MKKIYISCYENNDMSFKQAIIDLNKKRNNCLFELINSSESEIENEFLSLNNDEESFIHRIRNKYLRDADVMILLVGLETKKRKTIDWELRAAMSQTNLFSKSGILIVYLPEIIERFGAKIPRSILPNILLKNINTKDTFIVETIYSRLFKQFSYIEKCINVSYAYGQMSKYDVDESIKKNDDSNLF
ncbi:MAG: TIR domain-containing protein [Malacoplasma sp.]